MSRRLLVSGSVVGAIAVVSLLVYLAGRGTMDIFQPAGQIASQERDLILFATLLSLIVVLPVFALTIYIVWRYRATNHKATYKPDWDHSRLAETLWWVIPSVLIGVLAVTAWRSSHSLDPVQAIASNQAPIEVEVIALQWKWLFIYPESNVASVNQLELPVGRPVHFNITADAPMNSFWIPQLGGQIYAMPGMSTQLNLIADQTGNYRGSSANVSGSGFADMHFMAHAVPATDFAQWLSQTKNNRKTLSSDEYHRLATPGTGGITTYGQVTPNLYDNVVNSFMGSHLHVSGAAE